MSLTIGGKLKPGPFPGALMLDIEGKHERLFVAPLDKPGSHQRDEVMVGLEQRTLGAGRTICLDMPRAATIVQWFNREPGKPGFSTVLTIDSAVGSRRDMLTLIRTADELPVMPALTVSIEHWVSGMVRSHREAVLVLGQIGQLYDWLRAFWFDGLPGVSRRRPDESGEQFAARKGESLS